MADNYKIGEKAYVAVLDMPNLIPLATFDHKYEGIAKYPSVTRDISMVMKKEVLAGQIEEIIEQRGGKILESYKLFDVYEGAQVLAGHKSVAYSITFRAKDHTLEEGELRELLSRRDPEVSAYLKDQARQTALSRYGNQVFVRGLIEFTNYCKNDCYYCGIRKGNRKAERYRLGREEILECCRKGYVLGFRTFVLQGGEDPWYTDDRIAELVRDIKKEHSDCAVTLSVGEKEREAYQKLFDAGADRYLLRHETVCEEHYRTLHPPSMSYDHRQECLRNLKDIGFQTGCGFMVGTPGQTAENLADELLFLKEFQPAMVGIGPFIPHRDTPFGTKARECRAYSVSSGTDPPAASESPASGHNCPWNHFR